MRRTALLYIMTFLPSMIFAQEISGRKDVIINSTTSNIDSIGMAQSIEQPSKIEGAALADTLHLPTIYSYGGSPMLYPYSFLGGFDEWDLHEGLNASMGMSVIASFGKHAYHGAGFAQNLSLMYAIPLNKRISLAIGGYYSHLNWNGCDYHDGGFSAILGYHFNDRWDGYIYGQKSIVDPKMPMPLMYMNDNIGDKIGAMVRYKVNPSISIGVSVETDRLNNNKIPRPIPPQNRK